MPNQFIWGLFVPVLLAVAVETLSAADIVTIKSSEKNVSGDVSQVTKTELTINAGLKKDKITKIPANDIARVKWDGEPISLRLAINAELQGHLADALQRYSQLQADNKSNRPYLKADLSFFIARTTAKISLTDPTMLDEAAQKLDDFCQANGSSFRYYEALSHLGEIYLAKKNFNQAQATFQQIAQAPWLDYQMAARSAGAKLLLFQSKVSEAQAEFDAVSKMPAKTAAELSQKYEAMLGKTVCLQRQGQHQAAIQELVTVTNQADVENTRLQAEAYVRQGDSYRQLDLPQPKSAILAYLHVDILFRKEAALHAEALYRLWQLFTAVGDPDKAADVASRLETRYPNSEWTKKLADVGGG